MAHIKKSKMPKSWPIARKTRTKRFILAPAHAKRKSINLLFVLRDMLGIAKTRRELRKILHQGDISVNNRVRKSEAFPIQILDVISLKKQNKYYKLEIINKKFSLKEIKKSEAGTKISKIVGKNELSKDKTQLNLEDGTNVLYKDKFNVGDSAVVNTEKNSIEKILPLKEKSKVEIVSGKHAGEKGSVVEIEQLARSKAYKIKLEDKEVDLPIKTLLVIE